MRRRPQQLIMTFGWGGWRPGAGRKPSRGGRRKADHRQRPKVNARYPLHVTLKFRRELRSMRKKTRVSVIRAAFVAGCEREGFRVIDWSIQDDHLHIIVEAHDNQSLSRGIQGLSVRISRGLNRILHRSGSVFADRFHMRVLKTPREVRAARAYVINNLRRHEAQHGRVMPSGWVDPFSSWAWFDGWRDCKTARQEEARAGPRAQRLAVSAHCWLLKAGWRRHGLVRVDEVPGLKTRGLACQTLTTAPAAGSVLESPTCELSQ